MQKKYTGFIVFYFVLSCSITKNINKTDIIGKYQWRGGHGVFSTLTIEDSTFEYTCLQGPDFGVTKGTWVIEKKYLILNNKRQKEDEPTYKITPVPQTSQEYYEIRVLDEYGDKLGFVNCVLGNEKDIIEKSITNSKGICKLETNELATKMIIQFLGYNPVEIILDDLKIKSFDIELTVDQGYQRNFNNSKWLIGNDELFDTEENRRLIKVDTNG